MVRWAAIALLILTTKAFAEPNYHLVGWINTFVPGGGQFMLGDPLQGSVQAVVEVGTFGYGYTLSKRSPMTIDGVPEGLPQVGGNTIVNKHTQNICTQTGIVAGKTVCIKTKALTTTTDGISLDRTPQDFRKPIYADILQEFGLKYHMVNVFNSYREAAQRNGATDQMIDQRDTGDMFLDPFKVSNLINPWVFVPLLAVAGATVYDYGSNVRNGITPIASMNSISNALYGFNYIAWQPFGSGVPEEVFYRGFLQNEMYDIVPSPFFSIAMSTAAFSLSHSSTGRIGAAVSGLYLGFLAHKYHGNLAAGITLHFWSVVLLGVETYYLNRKAQGSDPPPGFQLGTTLVDFSF